MRKYLYWTDALLPCCAIATAFGLGACVLWASGVNVLVAYGSLVTGMAGSWQAVLETCVAATPYLLTGLAVALAFQGGLFNIGAEGQFYLGALSAAVVGYAITDWPAWVHLPLALLASALGGALWGAIPGFLKARVGGHEVINTIMMNYIAIKLVDYLVKQVLRDPTASLDRTPYVAVTAQLPQLFGPQHRFHAGVLLALVLAAALAWVLRQTTAGFVIQIVGANPDAARYAGMHVARTVVLLMATAGALAGLAGASEILGLHHTLPATFSTGYGFEAIAVALLAKARPLGVIPAALLWGGLRNGASFMQVHTGVSIDVINVIQGLILVCLAAERWLRWLYRLPAAQADAE